MIFGPGDLVERLRKYTVACRCEGCLMMMEAADEIERLRAAQDDYSWLDIVDDPA